MLKLPSSNLPENPQGAPHVFTIQGVNSLMYSMNFIPVWELCLLFIWGRRVTYTVILVSPSWCLVMEENGEVSSAELLLHSLENQLEEVRALIDVKLVSPAHNESIYYIPLWEASKIWRKMVLNFSLLLLFNSFWSDSLLIYIYWQSIAMPSIGSVNQMKCSYKLHVDEGQSIV